MIRLLEVMGCGECAPWKFVNYPPCAGCCGEANREGIGRMAIGSRGSECFGLSFFVTLVIQKSLSSLIQILLPGSLYCHFTVRTFPECD